MNFGLINKGCYLVIWYINLHGISYFGIQGYHGLNGITSLNYSTTENKWDFYVVRASLNLSVRVVKSLFIKITSL